MRNEVPSTNGLITVDRAGLDATLRVFDVAVAVLGRGAPVRQLRVLLAVHRLEPVSRYEIQVALGSPRTSVIADCMKLGDTDRFGKRGLGLISSRWDDHGRRHLLYSLTLSGREFIDRLAEAF